MKFTATQFKIVLLLTAFFTLPLFCLAQDIITTIDGTDIQAHIIRITDKSVKYRPFKEVDTTVTRSIRKENVFRINYENGLKEMFNQPAVYDSNQQGTGNKISMYEQGKQDAKRNYKAFKGARTVTELTTVLLSDLAGLIPAIACASTPPKDKNLHYPDAQLMKNPAYNDGYRNEAHRIKRRKVWGAFGAGAAINIVVYIAVVSLR